PASISLLARIGNSGTMSASSGVPVAFYSVDSTGALTALIGVAHSLGALQPGQYEDVALTIVSPTTTSLQFLAIADDDGTGSLGSSHVINGIVTECNESNNVGPVA